MKEYILGKYTIKLYGKKASLYENGIHIISLNSVTNISIDSFMDFILNPPVRPRFNSNKDRD